MGRTYVKVEMGEYFASVFVPSDVGSRLASGHADKGNLVPQDVLVIEMGGQGDFSPLRKSRMRGVLLVASKYLRCCCCNIGQILGLCIYR